MLYLDLKSEGLPRSAVGHLQLELTSIAIVGAQHAYKLGHVFLKAIKHCVVKITSLFRVAEEEKNQMNFCWLCK